MYHKKEVLGFVSSRDTAKLKLFIETCWPEVIEEKFVYVHFPRQYALDVLSRGGSWGWFGVQINKLWESMRGCVNEVNPDPDAMDQDGDGSSSFSAEEFDKQARLLASSVQELALEKSRVFELQKEIDSLGSQIADLKAGGGSVGGDWVAKSVHDKVVQDLAALRAR
jgi:hypothetical protein